MQEEDFYDLVSDIAERFLPEIPQKYVRGIKSAIYGGEYDIAAENLVYTIVDDKVPVSPEERDVLFRIVNDMKEKEVLLPKLGQLVVVEDETS